MVNHLWILHVVSSPYIETGFVDISYNYITLFLVIERRMSDLGTERYGGGLILINHDRSSGKRIKFF